MARRKLMYAGTELQFGKALYELKAPFGQCREMLDMIPEVEPGELSAADRDEGFAEARAWFDAEPELHAEAGTKVLLGRILPGTVALAARSRGLEALGPAPPAFESRLAGQISFTGERVDDLGSQMSAKMPAFDSNTVPPRLLEKPPEVLVSAVRQAVSSSEISPANSISEFLAAQDRAFLDSDIPALDGHTPREAALQPALRPKLIRLLKDRVRSTDEQNLANGATYDNNWLLRELGANEIVFEPPPYRQPRPKINDLPRVPIEDFDEEADDPVDVDFSHLPPPPPIAGEWEDEEAGRRLDEGLEPFETVQDALDELVASGSTILDDAMELVGDRLDETASAALVSSLIKAWFAFVPKGCRAPEIDFESLGLRFDAELKGVIRALQTPTEREFVSYMEDSPQPAMIMMLVAGTMDLFISGPKDARPKMQYQPVILAMLKAVVAELDQALRIP